MTRLRNLRQRAALPVADQAVSSLGSLLVLAAVASSVGEEVFGAFVLAYLAYAVALGVARSAGGDILLLRTAEGACKRTASRGPDAGRMLAFCAAVGGVVALGALAVAVAAPPPLQAPFLAMGLVVMPIVVQDGYRYLFFAWGVPSRALLIDTLWLTLQGVGFLLALAGPLPESVTALVLIWGSSALTAVVTAWLLSRQAPTWSGAMWWIRSEKGRARSLVADWLLMNGAVYAAFFVVAAVGGLAVAGALRAAQLLFAPFDAFFSGIRLVSLPALRTALARSREAFVRRILELATVLAGLAFLWGVVTLSVPDSIGALFLGQSWAEAEALLPAFAVGYIARAITLPCMDGFRCAAPDLRLVLTRIVTSALVAVAMTTGAAVAAGTGAAVALAIAWWLSLAVWFLSLRRVLRAHHGHGGVRALSLSVDPPSGTDPASSSGP